MPEFLVKKEETVSLPCRIEKDIMEEFKKVAEENRIDDLRGLVGDAIKLAIDNLKIEEDDE